MDELQRLLRGRKPVFIRHWVARLAADHAGDLTLHVAVFRHDHTAIHPAQRFHSSMGHLPGSLARRHQQHSAPPGPELCQRAAHGFVRQNRLQAGCDDGIRILTQCPIHKTALPSFLI